MQTALQRLGVDAANESGVRRVGSAEDYEYDAKLGWLIVSVDLSSTKQRLVSDFERLLKLHYANRKGRPKRAKTLRSIKYPLFCRPNVPA